jgi:hypothetical protein
MMPLESARHRAPMTAVGRYVALNIMADRCCRPDRPSESSGSRQHQHALGACDVRCSPRLCGNANTRACGWAVAWA